MQRWWVIFLWVSSLSIQGVAFYDTEPGVLEARAARLRAVLRPLAHCFTEQLAAVYRQYREVSWTQSYSGQNTG